jgi:molecular chaperone DnaK (HSP70)
MSEHEVLAVLIARARALGIADEPTSMTRMRQAAARASEALRSDATTEVSLPFLGVSSEGPIHLLVTLPAGGGPRLDPRIKLD